MCLYIYIYLCIYIYTYVHRVIYLLIHLYLPIYLIYLHTCTQTICGYCAPDLLLAEMLLFCCRQHALLRSSKLWRQGSSRLLCMYIYIYICRYISLASYLSIYMYVCLGRWHCMGMHMHGCIQCACAQTHTQPQPHSRTAFAHSSRSFSTAPSAHSHTQDTLLLAWPRSFMHNGPKS